MVTVRLTTWVNAPVDRCFRLATCAQLHALGGPASEVLSTRSQALQVGDTISWQASQWGLHLAHTCRINEVRPNSYFREEMVSGGFRHYVHEHHFAPMDDGTRMRDEVRFSAPMGPMGGVAERLLLKKYVMKLLIQQHMQVKRAAESVEWQAFLHGEQDADPAPEDHARITEMQRFA